MIYSKDGVTITDNNHTNSNLYLRYGWEPVVVSNTKKIFTEDDLKVLNVKAIKKLAEEQGYTVTAIKQSDCIKQFLEQQ